MTGNYAMSRDSRPSGEHGAVAVFVAILAVVFVGLAALAVDIGTAYGDRRQMQNASDAAAMAGTKVVKQARWSTGTPAGPGFVLDSAAANALPTVVDEVLTANGANPNDYTCNVLDPNRAVIAPCSPSSGWATLANDPVGVRVSARSTRPSFFGGIFGANTIDAAAQAAAEVRPVTGGTAAFLVCQRAQLAQGRNGPAMPDLLIPDGGATWPNVAEMNSAQTLDWWNNNFPPESYRVNQEAINQTVSAQGYEIHSSGVSDCGFTNNAFKGRGEPGQVSTIPGEWLGQNGDRSGPTGREVEDACGAEDVIGCKVLAPICLGPIQDKTSFYCPVMGVFQITYVGPGNSNNTHRAVLLGDQNVSGTITFGGSTPTANAPTSIQLVE